MLYKAIDLLESKSIALYNTYQKGYNETTGGQKGFESSELTRKKISKNNARYWKGKKFSDTHKQNLKENHSGMSGKQHSKESKDKMSVNNCRHWKGKKLSEEHRKKMSGAAKERWKRIKNET